MMERHTHLVIDHLVIVIGYVPKPRVLGRALGRVYLSRARRRLADTYARQPANSSMSHYTNSGRQVYRRSLLTRPLTTRLLADSLMLFIASVFGFWSLGVRGCVIAFCLFVFSATLGELLLSTSVVTRYSSVSATRPYWLLRVVGNVARCGLALLTTNISNHLTKSLPINDIKEEISMIKGKRHQDKLVRFQIEIRQSMLKEIEELQELGGASSKKELVNNAITLLRWAATQKQAGYNIASIDDDDDVHKELQMPYLEQIARHRKLYPVGLPSPRRDADRQGHLNDALLEGAAS